MFAPNQKLKRIPLGSMPAGFFETVSPAALRQSAYLEYPEFNSIWDMIVTRDERVYVAICAELSVSKSAKFCEFIPTTSEFIERFDVGRVTLAHERSIPESKIHTSMSLLPDGQIIMTTHNTAGAPGHPSWMIDSYYNHPWEGFLGSHILIYDPKTDQVENLGMPVPRDAIYGAAYDARNHRYYFATYIRGMVYCLDLTAREVTELGQGSEFGSFRLMPAMDGHIYIGSRTGRLTRINVDKMCLEDTGINIPCDPVSAYQRSQQLITYGNTGADGALYFTACFLPDLFRYDPTKNQVEKLGSFSPEVLGEWHHTRILQGMEFDRHGVLWYTCTTSIQSDFLGTHLVSWKIGEDEPRNHGLLGTRDRVAICLSELCIHQDTIYFADTNHGPDTPAVVSVDISKLRDRDIARGPDALDPKIYIVFDDYTEHFNDPEFLRRAKEYEQAVLHYAEAVSITYQNPFAVKARRYQPVHLWKYLPMADSKVRLLWREDTNTLHGISGDRNLHTWSLREGEWQGSQRCDEAFLEKRTLQQSNRELIQRKIIGAPFHSGRQYRSKTTAAAPWSDGTYLIGTEDSILGLVNESTAQCRSLGGLDTVGQVHQMLSTRDHSIAYGISGDPMDVGRLFVYDDTWGLRTLDRLFHFSYDEEDAGVASSNLLSALALSPDEQTLAIGSADRLACVYLLQGIDTRPFNSHLDEQA